MSDLQELFARTLNPTVDTAAYADGDVVGVGDAAHELTGIADNKGAYALLKSVMVVTETATDFPCDIFFFSADPVNSTLTDNAAFSLSDLDAPKLLGVVSVVAADYLDIGADSKIADVKNIDLVLKGDSAVNNAASVWVVIKARGAITFGDAADLTLRFGVLR